MVYSRFHVDYFSGQYFASRIIQAGWGIVIVSVIQLIASSCSVFICMRLIYKNESNLESAVNKNIFSYLFPQIQTKFSFCSNQSHTFMMKFHHLRPDFVGR